MEFLINNYIKQYLTRKISAGRRFDLITFFYTKIPSDSAFNDEEAIVRRAHSNRSPPPTLDALIPRYCVVFVDCIGKRRSAYRENPMWQTLQRVVITSVIYHRADHDLSPTIAFVRDHRFDAVYLLSSIIPVLSVTTFDVVGSTASINPEMITTGFHHFTKAFNLIKGTIRRDVQVSAICEIDLKKNFNLTHPLRVTLTIGKEWRYRRLVTHQFLLHNMSTFAS